MEVRTISNITYLNIILLKMYICYAFFLSTYYLLAMPFPQLFFSLAMVGSENIKTTKSENLIKSPVGTTSERGDLHLLYLNEA